MAKSLKDIIGPRAGRNVSKDEEDILDTLKVDKKEDPAGNKDDVFNATKVPAEASSQKADPGKRHGYRTVQAAAAAYEETVVEQKKKKPLTPEDDRNVNGKDYGYAAGAKGNGSAVGEEVEQVDELDRNQGSMLNRYISKTTDNPKRKEGRDLALKKKWGDKNYGLPEPKVKAVQREETEELDEVLKSSDPTSKWISHFVHSKNPKFSDKSKKQRIQQALGAKYAKMREEFYASLKEDKDYEGQMAKTQLKALANKAMNLVMMMQDNQELEAWVQAKLTNAKHDIDAVHDYLTYGDHEDNDDKEMENEITGPDTPISYPNMNIDTSLGRA